MTIQNVPIGLIDDNPYQPRTSYPTSKIDELAYSILQVGLRQVPEARKKNGRFQMAYGHMRKRAFAKAIKRGPGKVINSSTEDIKNGTMPLDVKDLTDQQMIEYAIEENLRRADITPMDVARTIELYLNIFKKETVTSTGVKFNLSQGAVSNMLRVLKCPAEVLEKIDSGKINFTMARELLIFQGKTAKGEHTSYPGGKEKKVPKDENWLMLEAIKKVGTQYGPPATVDGIKKAIFTVASENFPALEKGGSYYYSRFEPLFDTRSAGCLKCEHAITCYETKSQTRHFCTMPGCWEQRQEAHKKLQAKEAKKLADAAVKKQITEMEQQRAAAATKTIPQEMTADTGKTDEPIPSETKAEEPAATISSALQKPQPPQNIKEAAKAQAGTRAEILDLRDIKAGNYGDLKHGYVLLDSGFNAPLENMEDPQECIERCTKGFHYAYDSNDREGRVRSVCTDPKCVTRKKSAFTRAKNAAGQALKRAEMAGIREAVDKTDVLDQPRMLLILEAEMLGRHTRSYSYTRNDTKEVLMKILGIEKKDQYENESDTVKRIREVLFKKTEAELAKVIVEFMLRMFTYEGEMQDYKANTTGYLNLMGVEVSDEKKGGNEADAGPFRGRAEKAV